MKSLLKKRLPGILATGLVALAVGVAGAPASAATAETSSGATVSGLTKKQKKAKKKALKKCNKKNSAKKKKKCKKQVNKKYKKLAKKNNAPAGKTYTVNLGDNYFAPSTVNLKVNDSINWSWADVGGFEAHNVTLDQGPDGVSRNDFLSQTTAVNSYRFKRTFKKAGGYSFVCSLHFGMTMNANVTN
jgi:plastocyanin